MQLTATEVNDMFERFRKRGSPAGTDPPTIDPVCGMSLRPAEAAAQRVVNGQAVYLCSDACAARFDRDPTAHAARLADPTERGHSR